MDHLEQQRKKEEAARNERRFDAYNTRRRAAGLPELSWTDYVCRKHGLPPIAARIEQLTAAPEPQHRDNILLFSRHG